MIFTLVYPVFANCVIIIARQPHKRHHCVCNGYCRAYQCIILHFIITFSTWFQLIHYNFWLFVCFARAHKFICTTIKCVQVPRSHFIIGVAFRLLFYGFIYCCLIILLLLGALLKFCVHKQPPQTFNFRIHIFKKWDCEWQIFVTIFISRINFAAFNFRGTRFF